MIDVGSTVGPYEIVSLINRGGMAALFLGRREGPGGFARHVAVKVIHPHLAQDENFIHMFFDEARLSARIQHPNVVHVEELGEAEGDYYLVMEYLHGATLAQLLTKLSEEGRRLTPAQTVWVGMQTADGLHAAHELRDEQGSPLSLVHRDISPQNVLLSSSGHVKVIDFGVAKASGRQQLSVTGALKGKYAYMSPEQARGDRVDRRTDVYALGIVLWELLAMRRLFRGRNEVEVLDKVRNPVVRPPSEHMAGIPPALDEVVLKALAADREARFQTCRDLRVALLAAMPEAASVDDLQMATVLTAAMGEQLATKREALPTSVSGVQLPAMMPTGPRLELLREHTHSAPGAHYGRTEMSPDELALADEMVSYAPGDTRQAKGLSPSQPPPGQMATPSSTTAGGGRRRKAVAAVAVIGVLAAVAGGVGIYLSRSSPSRAEEPENGRLLVGVHHGVSIEEAEARETADAGPAPAATQAEPPTQPPAEGSAEASTGEGEVGEPGSEDGSEDEGAGTAAPAAPVPARVPRRGTGRNTMMQVAMAMMGGSVVPGALIFEDDDY